METVTELVKENLSKTQQRQKQQYDRTVHEREMQQDDEVLVLLLTQSRNC